MTGLPTVSATRYVAPLREGGSLPGLVEADDLGTYVCKFRGAGQGLKVLVAEVIVAELARRLEIRTPDLVAVELSEAIGRYEADEEVQDLLTASLGSNLGVDFLPGSFGFDTSVEVTPDFAGRLVWLDAYVANVDRSWRNPNLLVWHGRPWLIDHGASLYIHHTWRDPDAHARRPHTERLADHVLLPVASSIAAADERLAPLVTDALLESLVTAVPDDWLAPDPLIGTAAEQRQAYVAYLRGRLEAPRPFVDAAETLRRAAAAAA